MARWRRRAIVAAGDFLAAVLAFAPLRSRPSLLMMVPFTLVAASRAGDRRLHLSVRRSRFIAVRDFRAERRDHGGADRGFRARGRPPPTACRGRVAPAADPA